MTPQDKRYGDLVREQSHLLRLERLYSRRIYERSFDQAIDSGFVSLETAHHRALYMSWSSTSIFWTLMGLVPGMLIFSANRWLHGTAQVAAVALGAVGLLGCFTAGYVRIRQSQRLHPEWRSYSQTSQIFRNRGR